MEVDGAGGCEYREEWKETVWMHGDGCRHAVCKYAIEKMQMELREER